MHRIAEMSWASNRIDELDFFERLNTPSSEIMYVCMYVHMYVYQIDLCFGELSNQPPDVYVWMYSMRPR